MVVNFFKQKRIIFLFFLLIQTFQFIYSKNIDISTDRPIIFVDQDKTSDELLFDISPELKSEQYTQSLAYLSNDKLRNGVSKAEDFQREFKYLGKDVFSKFVVDPISKEIELRDDYYVFYHGQKREFLLIQDLYAKLSELFRKKALKDFVMLRVPENDHKKFKNVKGFIKEYKDEMKNFQGWFDGQNHINKILLAVNPFLFGNTSNAWGGECTFKYFLDSRSISHVSISTLAKDVFKHFSVMCEKYDFQINELFNCLWMYETNKTGLLLQIFVPKKIVNDISYRCIPGGKLYDKNNAPVNLNTYQAPKNGLLNKYLLDPLNSTKYYLNCGFSFSYAIPTALAATFIYKYFNNYDLAMKLWRFAIEAAIKAKFDFNSVDSMQFRILLTEDIMLNPDSGVKIFRYCNETEAVKEYKQKFNKLIEDVKWDYCL